MNKVSFDIVLLSPDGKEEIGVIPKELMEQYMGLKKIKSRSTAIIKKAALTLVREAVEDARKVVSTKKTKKKGKKKS